MRRIIDFLMRLGVVEGITFRLSHEDGVGLFITPNPQPNRMHFNAILTPHRYVKKRAPGCWIAKPIHVTWDQ